MLTVLLFPARSAAQPSLPQASWSLEVDGRDRAEDAAAVLEPLALVFDVREDGGLGVDSELHGVARGDGLAYGGLRPGLPRHGGRIADGRSDL